MENIIIKGSVSDMASMQNLSTEHRINILFHTIAAATLTINNMLIHQAYVGSYWEGVYNSIGIGAVKNAVVIAKNLYIGDYIHTMINPLVGYESPIDYQHDVNCSDKMSQDIENEIILINQMPKQLGSRWSRL